MFTERLIIICNIFRIISDIVDKALNEEKLEYKDNEVNSIFLSILQSDELDIREKKSGLIDFITAGIDTVILLFL